MISAGEAEQSLELDLGGKRLSILTSSMFFMCTEGEVFEAYCQQCYSLQK